MKEKDTEELFSELKEDGDIKAFLNRNKDELLPPVSEYLRGLMQEKDLRLSDVIKASCLNRNYAYHIFSGEKPNPSRVKLLALALAMKLNLDEMQHLLLCGGHSTLYPRSPWDSVIISAVEQGLSVTDTNLLLEQLGETEILG
jgi:transcriptional regulator with XRE-family HTH domain